MKVVIGSELIPDDETKIGPKEFRGTKQKEIV